MTERAAAPVSLIDTHCHLDEPVLAGRLDEVLTNARQAGVVQYVIPGVAVEHWPRIAELCDRSHGLFPAYGVHPMHAAGVSSSVMELLGKMLSHAVAVGEIGLDYLHSDIPRAVQAEVFRQQLRLAVHAGLPVLIHCRRAFQDLLAILKDERVWLVGGVMHAFSGSPEVAEECIRLGLSISVAGPVTWLNSMKPKRVVEHVPLTHLVLETDAPDLSPEPCRGSKNEPAFLRRIAEVVARIKGIPYSEVADQTTANARRILGLPKGTN